MTKYQRDLVTGSRDASRFRLAMDREVGDILDRNPRTPRVIHALDRAYARYCRGAEPTRGLFNESYRCAHTTP